MSSWSCKTHIVLTPEMMNYVGFVERRFKWSRYILVSTNACARNACFQGKFQKVAHSVLNLYKIMIKQFCNIFDKKYFKADKFPFLE